MIRLFRGDNYGVAVPGWWMAEISGVFLAAAIIVGVITRMGEEVAPSVPLLTARGIYWRGANYWYRARIVVVMDNGMINSTPFCTARRLVPASTTIFINVTYWLEKYCSPSRCLLFRSALTMPICAVSGFRPYVQRDLVVTAYQSASGIVNSLRPNSCRTARSLAIARFPMSAIWKWVAPQAADPDIAEYGGTEHRSDDVTSQMATRLI